MKAISDDLLVEFSKKWGVSQDAVTTIFTIIKDSGRKYGRSSRMLKVLGIELSQRQLKYFYKRVNFYVKHGIDIKGRPTNYSALLRKNT